MTQTQRLALLSARDTAENAMLELALPDESGAFDSFRRVVARINEALTDGEMMAPGGFGAVGRHRY